MRPSLRPVAPRSAEPPSSKGSTRTGLLWIRRVGAALLLTMAGLGLVVSAGMVLGFSAIDTRVQRLAKTLGVDVSIRHVDLGLGRPTVAHGVSVTVPNGPDLVMKSIAADLDLSALVGGQRRPNTTTIRGLRMRLAVNRDGVVGLAPVLERWAARKGPDPSKASASGSEPMSVHLKDSSLLVEVRDEALPRMTLLLEDVSASLSRDSSRVSLTASASFEWVGQRRRGTLVAEIDGKQLRRVEASFDAPLTIPLTLGDRRYLATLGGVVVDREEGLTQLTGVVVDDGVLRVGANRIEISDTAGSLGIPGMRQIATLAVTGGTVKRRDDVASAKSVSVELKWPQHGRWPIVKRLSVVDARAEVPGRGIVASAEAASLGFDRVIDPSEPSSLEDLAEAITTVTLDTPTATITVREGQWASFLPSRVRRLLPGQPAQSPRKARVLPPGQRGKASPRKRMQRMVRLLRRLPIAIEDGLVSFKEHGVGPVLTLDNVGLRLKPGEGDTLSVDMDAMMVRDGQPTGQIQLTTSLDEDGRPTTAKGLVAGQDFAHLASRFSTYVAVPPTADLEVAFSWNPPTKEHPTHRLSGKAKLKNFGFEAWRIAHVPIAGIKGDVDYNIGYHPEQKRLILDLPKIRLGKATMHAKLDLTAPQKDSKAKISARLGMPKQDCSDVRQSIPAALLPRLAGLKMRGSMHFEAALDVDMDEPKKLTLDVTGSMESCQVLTLGEIDLNKLKGDFVHYPVEPKKGVRKDLPVGSGTKQWVPSRRLPRLVKAAAIVTEDRSYWKHGGVRWTLVRRALKLNLKHGRFVYGGSTITQQLVKNLYLTREKALSRKLEEAIIAMHMERVLTKDEILTIYVNVVEFGPDIYGVKKAARFYFGKHPKHLSPLEAAFIMGLKPWPRGGYKQWSNGSVNAYWVKRLEHILSMMNRIEGAITEDEVLEAAPYQPKFRPRGASHSWGTPYRRP